MSTDARRRPALDLALAVQGIRELGTLVRMTLSLYVFDLAAEDFESEERQFIEAVAGLVSV